MKRRLLFAWLGVLAACGARTGLFVSEEQVADAGADAGDAGRDARPDHFDAGDAHDALDAFDAPEEPLPDVFRSDCTDAAYTYIYLVSDQRELFSFDPAIGVFHDIGNINCPTSDNGFSMAVDRKGTAYVLLAALSPMGTPSVGTLWQVSTANASCKAIPQYIPNQQGFGVFGMGFATIAGGPSETLYVLGASAFFGSTQGLATIDTTTFQLSYVGTNNPPLQGGELTGTGDGRLFTFGFYSSTGAPTYLAQLDKNTGSVIQQTPLTLSLANQAFATAFWGGDFYMFTAPQGGPTTVTRYRPADGSFVQVGSLGAQIVGAGVSTCAPQG